MPKSKSKVAWQQCRLRDVIIAHVISADAHTDTENASNLRTIQPRAKRAAGW